MRGSRKLTDEVRPGPLKNGRLLSGEERLARLPGSRVNGAEKLGHWGAGIVYHLPDDRGP